MQPYLQAVLVGVAELEAHPLAVALLAAGALPVRRAVGHAVPEEGEEVKQ